MMYGCMSTYGEGPRALIKAGSPTEALSTYFRLTAQENVETAVVVGVFRRCPVKVTTYPLNDDLFWAFEDWYEGNTWRPTAFEHVVGDFLDD